MPEDGKGAFAKKANMLQMWPKTDPSPYFMLTVKAID